MEAGYKLERENFIRGHNGSSVQEVLALVTIGQLSNFLLVSILSLFCCLPTLKIRSLRFLFELAVIFGPFTLAITVLSDHVYYVVVVILMLTLITILLCFVTKNMQIPNCQELLDLNLAEDKKVPLVSNLVSSLLMCVCLAILAVDFPCFPRRFAKTEMYGWSLMDVGVGGFVAINGGLSPEARLMSHQPIYLIKKTAISVLPMIILGFQRLLAVKSLNYHEHITEYGLHWNFFFTLAFTKIFSTGFYCLFSTKISSSAASIILLIIHQFLLTWCGFSNFIQNDDRSGLFAANKEGIISLSGYLSLHLLFVDVGRFVFKKRNNLREWISCATLIWSLTIIFGILMIVSHNYVEKISRREANFAFTCWMIVFIFFLIALEISTQILLRVFQHCQVFSKELGSSSLVFSSLSRHGMLLFLLANLLTGAVNFFVDTLNSNCLKCIFILLAYSSILSYFGITFDLKMFKFFDKKKIN